MPAPARTALLAIFALLVATLLTGAQAAARETVPAAGERLTAALPSTADAFRSARTYPTVAVPVRLRIPALHVNSPLQRLDRQPDGTVAVPDRADVAGWYERGPRPGQAGPAVILGHVDSHTGPGVFLNLTRVPRGAAVLVDRADGSTVTFRVTNVQRVSKTRFPTDLVYAPTLLPTLRLVTCGGSFDTTRRSYRDNVIAFAAAA
jgi:sortase (surface protein transpeptidase)